MPKVSVLIPTYNREHFLRDALESLVKQTSVDFEVVVSDNASEDGTQECVTSFMKELPNLRYLRHDKTIAIHENHITTYNMAQGEYIKWLMDDDILEPRCIETMAKYLDEYPEVTLVTSKRTIIDEYGIEQPDIPATYPIIDHDAFIKGDKLIEIILGTGLNMIGEPSTVMFRKSDVPESWPKFIGHEMRLNGDIGLWFYLLTKGDAIYLINPLSRFRRHQKQDQTNRPDAYILGTIDWFIMLREMKSLGYMKDPSIYKHALRLYIERGEVLLNSIQKDNLYHDELAEQVCWLQKEMDTFDKLKSPEEDCTPQAYLPIVRKPKVSIIIPVYNNVLLTKNCLYSIFEVTQESDFEVIVVDNNSQDGTAEFLLNEVGPRIKVIHNNENLGFAKACNQGALQASGDYLLFLNNDTVVTTEDWLAKMLEPFSKDKLIGIVGCKLLYPDNSIQHAGVGFLDKNGEYEPVHVYRGDSRYSKNVMFSQEIQAVTGACLLIERNLFSDVEMMDEGYINGLEDIDLCLKVKIKGYKVFYESAAEVYHLESQSAGRFKFAHENIERFLNKWNKYGLIETDAEGTDGKFSWIKEKASISKLITNNDCLVSLRKTSIIILTLNNLAYTKLCIESIISNTQGQYELVIVDNGSTDGTKEYLKEIRKDYPNFHLIFNDKNEGYAYACNQGALLASGEYLIFLNNDVILPPNWLQNLIYPFKRDKKIGIIGPNTNYCVGLQKVAGVKYEMESFDAFSENWEDQNTNKLTEVESVIGFCMAIKKSVLDIIGGYDTDFGTGNFEDIDICLRARLVGFKIVINHNVFVHHFGNKTFSNEKIDYTTLMRKNKQIYNAKWQSFSDKVSEDEKLASLYVPLNNKDTFNKEVPPIAINALKHLNILAIPDWHDQVTWYSLIAQFLQLIQTKPEFYLILRVDPPIDSEFQSVIEHLNNIMQDMGIEDIPNLILEGTSLIPSRRGGLYTACNYFIDLPQQRGFLYRRAAEACGCEVITVDEIVKVSAS